MQALIDAILSLRPELAALGAASVARVSTTRPVYLIFFAPHQWPQCVAQSGNVAQVGSSQRILQTISKLDPGLVPEPLGSLTLGESSSFSIVKGSRGWPWFSAWRRFDSPGGFESLNAMAATALRRFSRAVADVDGWRGRIDAAAELGRVFSVAASGEPRIGDRYGTTVPETLEAPLAALGVIDWRYQHGDFCVNNLIFEEAEAVVIDLEEFGETLMPLHDEMSLAESLCDWQQRGLVRTEFNEVLKRCTEPEGQAFLRDDGVLTALRVHHLCFRINQCRSRPGRHSMAERLTQLLLEALDTARAQSRGC